MLYPVLFEPIYKEKLWGGAGMEKYGRVLPTPRIGESWDISCRAGDMSIVENGAHRGLTFDALIATDRSIYLGRRMSKTSGFPLLIKIIDANEDLSVQVHPGEEGIAKNEMWYIMEAPPGGSIVLGLKDGTTPETLRREPMKCLKNLPVKKGDIIEIPAGLVHALTKGVMVAEIQQNSDTTYRLYDYGRTGLDGKPRELHLEKGFAVVDYPINFNSKSTDSRVIVNPYFTVIKYILDGTITENSDPDAFCCFTCVRGECEINDVPVRCSRSVFIPAGLGEYKMRGRAVLLKSFVTIK